MSVKISFQNQQTDFTSELKKEVDQYFTSSGVPTTGNWRLYTKTIVLILSAITFYTVLVFFTPPAWIALALCALFGLNLAVIGFNVMHDGAHGSYSDKKWLNEMMSYTLNLMGGSSFFWKIKHNVIHHSYTNIEGHDDDIDIRPWIRTNEHQKKYWFHKYQHFYWAFFYQLTYIWWVFVMDFQKYFTRKIASHSIKKISFQEHLIFWATKLVYTAVFIVIPALYVGLVPAILGYLTAALSSGLVLSIVFQLAHVVEDTAFPVPDEKSRKMEKVWFLHQFATTANFSTRSKVITWLTGGLNYQLEHHLFPRISHIHYPALSKVIRNVCSKHEVPYIEYPTMLQAIRSHVAYLKSVGRQ